ncbi:MAG: protein kinase [Solirubrobacterales bacterium]
MNPGSTSAQMIGTVLSGRYRLEARLGSGGMSTVYLARDETLDRQVAVKLMHREMSEQADQLQRFHREARAVAKISHPNVVTVIDAGEDQGRPYIVFEYVEGETLKQRISRAGALDIQEAIAYAIEIARGLTVAHARQMVHRDIKPQNVLIDSEGRAKLTDFGISRQLEQDGLTATGRVLGTTDYVAPEQAMGQGVDPRSDIYSLGVVLYEMLTGDVPFTADSQVGVAMKHVNEELPDVQGRRPEVSAAVALVVERATFKDPARRYQSIEEMIADLETALEVEAARAGSTTGEATSVLDAVPPPRRRLAVRERWSWKTFGLVLLVAAIVLSAVYGISAGWFGGGGAGGGNREGGGSNPVKVTSATDYDPVGGDGEHPELLTRVTDDNPAVTGGSWTTETYDTNFPEAKAGVGLYLTTADPVAAKTLQVRSAKGGWDLQVYAAPSAPSDGAADPLAGWTKVGEKSGMAANQSVALDTGGRNLTDYLLWITKLAPVSDGYRVEITDARLYD